MCCESSPVVFEWKGYFLELFTLMSVEVNMFSVSARLFGMVIWAIFFVFLGRDCLRKMVGAEVVIEVVVEVVLLVWWR